MRLGKYPCQLVEGTKARAAYGAELIYERHRHRTRSITATATFLAAAGMIWTDNRPMASYVEIAEVRDHPFMVGSQFHPEFKKRAPTARTPLFRDFIAAALNKE
jgi:CTP synthase